MLITFHSPFRFWPLEFFELTSLLTFSGPGEAELSGAELGVLVTKTGDVSAGLATDAADPRFFSL